MPTCTTDLGAPESTAYIRKAVVQEVSQMRTADSELGLSERQLSRRRVK